jgi:hypothetical protein
MENVSGFTLLPPEGVGAPELGQKHGTLARRFKGLLQVLDRLLELAELFRD